MTLNYTSRQTLCLRPCTQYFLSSISAALDRDHTSVDLTMLYKGTRSLQSVFGNTYSQYQSQLEQPDGDCVVGVTIGRSSEPKLGYHEGSQECRHGKWFGSMGLAACMLRHSGVLQTPSSIVSAT